MAEGRGQDEDTQECADGRGDKSVANQEAEPEEIFNM